MVTASSASDPTDVSVSLAELAALMAERQAMAAPYEAEIRRLEVAKADALASLTFQIETLQAQIRPLILAEQRTTKVGGCTASYVHKETWDNDALRQFAEEVPAVLQCLRDSSYVTFRMK
jgi:hypothetical protein